MRETGVEDEREWGKRESEEGRERWGKGAGGGGGGGKAVYQSLLLFFDAVKAFCAYLRENRGRWVVTCKKAR